MKLLVSILSLAAVLLVQTSLEAGLVARRKPAPEASDLSGPAIAKSVDPAPMAEMVLAGKTGLEWYHLIVIVATATLAAILIIAILGYDLFGSGEKKRKDDLRDLP